MPWTGAPISAKKPILRALAAALLTAASGCAGTYEGVVQEDLERAARTQAGEPDGGAAPAPRPADLGRGLDAYVAYAMARSPELSASFERWRAGVLRISRARRLPEPTLTYGFFIRNVETRVGPQRHRLSLQQTFPWPTKLIAGADAASAEARALERRFDAQALAIRRRVAEAYWRLWLIRKTREIQRGQLDVVRGLSESARALVATGRATLADLLQIDLSAARLEDMIEGLGEAERSAEADLIAAIGAPAGTRAPTPGAPPDPALPAESEAALRQVALDHPLIESFSLMSEARESAARSQEADGLPSFMVGLDWIETGEARMPGVTDSGKDALIVGVGLRVPLWQGSYSEAARAAQAEAAAQRAEGRAAADRAAAEVTAALAALRDAARRVRLHRSTLLPQAETAFTSVLGAYATGQSSVSAAMLAQRDLLELHIGLARARAEHAMAWARLEQVVGHTIERVAIREEKAR